MAELAEVLRRLLQQQSTQQIELTNAIQSLIQNPHTSHSDLYSTINNQLHEFTYNPENDSTFNQWLERFGPYIQVDGKDLPDAMQVRLLLSKLGLEEYNKYSESVLPAKPVDFTLQQSIIKLKALFCKTKSLCIRRFECFQLCKAISQSPLDFASQVNAQCEKAKLTLTKEELKAMIFISGLSDDERELRERCLKTLEDANKKTPPEVVSFDKLTEECRTFLSLRSSAAALGQQTHSANAIANKPQRLNERQKRNRSNSPNFSRRSKEASNKVSSEGQPWRRTKKDPPYACTFCGRMHWMSDCHKAPTCAKCHRRGHYQANCPRPRPSSVSSTRGPRRYNAAMSVLTVNGVHATDWIWCDCSINGFPVSLMADTGSKLAVITEVMWKKLGEPILVGTNTKATSYSGHSFKLAGKFACAVSFQGVILQLECYMAPHGSMNLFGLPWIKAFETALQRPIATTLGPALAQQLTNAVDVTSDPDKLANSLKQLFPQIFSPQLGHCNKMRAHLHLRPDAQPVFCRARPVPHGAKAAIDAELDRLIEHEVIKQVDYSKWAAPIVVVKKKSGNVRVCIDFATGLNNCLELNRHPLPRIEDIFSSLEGAKVFSQIDFKDAYFQVELNEESKELVGVNTHRGIFQYQRLPFGIKSAPSIFQKLMDELTANLDGVVGYLDDFIIATPTYQQHHELIRRFFNRIQEWGLKLQLDKCKFFCPQLKFLGHIVSADGIRPDPDRSEAIKAMPAPHDTQTLRSFLGALNYYGRFIKEMRELRAPLDKLLKKDTPWQWTNEQQSAFEKAKQIIVSDLLLTHYDPNKPIVVAADASLRGIGATISHTFPDGSEKVVEHASRSLSAAEQNYSQIEKEALGLIFAVQKFHRMIYGRRFTLLTDHKPLVAIFGSKSGIPIYTALRLQRWALILSNYDFSIRYVSTNAFGQVDVLSRLVAQQREASQSEDQVIATLIDRPLSNLAHNTPLEEESIAAVDYVFMANIEQMPVTAEEVVAHSQDDLILRKVFDFCRNGWPNKTSPEFTAYFTHRHKLSEVNGCLLFGERVIIPATLRERILKALHFTHPGIVRMKALAKQHVYWPRLDLDVERWVRHCHDCAIAAKAPIKAPLHPWPTTTKAYERLHMDFAGPCAYGLVYLVIVDVFSKWPEIFTMRRTTAEAVIVQLKWLFARYGFPLEIVSDNGSPFQSHEFANFCRVRGIKHTFSPPFHPQSNGQAERFVDILKRQMKKCSHQDNDWAQNSLFAYRSTPSAVLDGKSPAELFLGRSIRTTLSILRPSLKSKNLQTNSTSYTRKMESQFNQKNGTRERKFSPGDNVLILNYKNNKKVWLQGKVVEGLGVICKVHVPVLGVMVRRHINQMRHFVPVPQAAPIGETMQNDPPQVEQQSPRRVRFADEQPVPPNEEPETEAPAAAQPEQRRSTRQRRPRTTLEMDTSKSRYDIVPRR